MINSKQNLCFISKRIILLLVFFMFGFTSQSFAQNYLPQDNELQIINGTGSDCHIRIFNTNDKDNFIKEARITKGNSHTFSMKNGTFFNVTKFTDSLGRVSYSKSDNYSLMPEYGKYISASITLQKVLNGNFSSTSASSGDFGGEDDSDKSTSFNQSSKSDSGYAYVNISSLNMREGSSTKYKVIKILKEFDRLKVISRDGSWIKVRTQDGSTGWVSSKYVRE